MHACRLNSHKNTTRSLKFPFPNDAARSINMLLKSTGTYYYYYYYKNNKNTKKKSTDDETKSDLKLEDLYNSCQMFLEMWGFFLGEGDQGSYHQVSEVQSYHN
jgi:hypothetical protein